MARVKTPKVEMSDAILRCKALGHRWADFSPVDMKRPSFGWRLSLRCERCTTERHDLLNSLGELIGGGRQYVYVEGYREAEKLSRPELRMVLRNRIKRFGSEADLIQEAAREPLEVEEVS